MKKKVIFILSVIIFLSSIIVIYNKDKDEKLLSGEKTSELSSKSLLSMMLETSYQSGEYKTATAKEFPKKGYIFNAELSKCENGGKVTWNDTTKTVVVTSNISDKCYFYFDKDILVEITDYKITPSESEITISVTATTDYGNIVKYYFSIDDGKTYKDSTSNTYTFNITEIKTYKIKIYAEDGIGRKSGKKSKEQVVTAKPTNPTMAFDSSYNVVISGSTSRNGNVEYYYSLDNKSFTRGSSVTVSSTSTVYAYAVDTKNQKSDVVSKTVTIGTPQTGTVSTTYYCSKTNAYQSSSTCTYNYTGTRSSSPVCNSAMYPIYHNGKCGSRQIYNYSKSECDSWCSDVAYREKPASYACVQEGTGTESWSCYFYSAEDPFPYTCPNGGNLSGSTCIGATYSGSSRYKCSVSGKYYTTKAAATTGCTNYCANGSLYNSKCYKLG